MDRPNQAYWNRLSRKWTVSFPLAPGEEDVDWFARQAGRLGQLPLRVLLLGATPSLATMAWPEGTTLAALDWTDGMLREILPRQGVPPGGPVLADWRELPVATRSCDLILGDGCYTALGDQAGAVLLNAEMRRVLKPGGLACFRCFARPPRAASVDELIASLRQRLDVPFDLFRWHLAIAVQGPRWGVTLAEVWNVWNERIPDRSALAARQGWRADDLVRLERWQGETARYAFPSLEELRQLAASQFDVIETAVPSYPHGACFPRIALRARA